MSRPLRLHVPGVLVHVFARGNNKARIFIDDRDCEGFLARLARAFERFDVHCVMYCLLDNHYHLLVVPHEQPVSRAMQQLNSSYCQSFNRRHARVGHVLQGRFGSRLVGDREYARSAVRYLALNPVAAGLAAAPDGWRWSSYRALIGRAEPPPFLAANHVWTAFGTSDPETGRARVLEFVSAAVADSFPNPLLHGGEPLAHRVAPSIERHQSNHDFAYPYRFAARETLGTILQGCVTHDDVAIAAHAAFYRHGYTLATIGAFLGRDPSTICRWIQRVAAANPRDGAVSPGGAIRARNKI